MSTNKKKLRFFIAMVWVFGTILSALLYFIFPFFLDWNSCLRYEDSVCRYELYYSDDHALWGLMCFTLVIPALAMIIMYTAIVVIYRKHVSVMLSFYSAMIVGERTESPRTEAPLLFFTW